MPAPMSTSTVSAPETFPSEAGTFFLAGPAGRLEVAVDLPEPQDARPVVERPFQHFVVPDGES